MRWKQFGKWKGEANCNSLIALPENRNSRTTSLPHAVNLQRLAVDRTRNRYFVADMLVHFGLIVDLVDFAAGHEY